MINICQHCGQEFETGKGGRRTLFCPDPECQAFKRQRYLDQMKEATRRARAKMKKKEAKPPKGHNGYFCQKCGKPLTGSRRYNCVKCEESILDSTNCDGNWLYAPEIGDFEDLIMEGI